MSRCYINILFGMLLEPHSFSVCVPRLVINTGSFIAPGSQILFLLSPSCFLPTNFLPAGGNVSSFLQALQTRNITNFFVVVLKIAEIKVFLLHVFASSHARN